ncbi:Uncharacterised protein [Mycobacteroides abscessus subsp. abscessus]|nr:Uncharacterised protein [Mycobacteroides abscessus subsp. abscessus]
MMGGGDRPANVRCTQCGTDIGDPDGNLILFCGAEA